MTMLIEDIKKTLDHRNFRGVIVNVLHCNIVVNEFDFQSLYHFHFRTNTI